MSAHLPDRVIIGVDVGTTGVKAAAFGIDLAWSRVTIDEYPPPTPVVGEHVQDPGAVVDAAGRALASCVGQTHGAEVVAISVSAAMHGLMALDAEHRPITPIVTWADARATDEARDLHRDGQAAELHRATGVPVHPMTPLTKLRWFARHEPDTFARARWWCGLKDYVLWSLTGRLVTELSSASGSGLLDLSTRTWNAAALAVAGVDPARLPEILPTTSTLPLAAGAATRIGLPAGLPVVLGAADGPLANVGIGALGKGTLGHGGGVAGLSVGTSSAVRMVVDRPRTDPAGALFCYALTDELWVIGGALGNGGNVVRWAARSLAPDLASAAPDGHRDDAMLDLAATAPAGCAGLVMLPNLLPARAPGWDPDAPGAYLGVADHHTRAHFARAAIEGVCLEMRLVLDALDQVEPVTSVRGTGGAFRSALWRDVMAAVLGRPFIAVDDAEGTARGAAVLGLVAIGLAPDLATGLAQLTDPTAPVPTAEPTDPEVVATYDELRASIPHLVGRLDRAAAAFATFTPEQHGPSGGTDR